MSKEEIEYVELRLRVPKAIVDFLRAHETDLGKSVEEYLEYGIVSVVAGDIDVNEDWTFYNPQSKAKGWGLEKVFDEIIYKPFRTVEVMEESIKDMEEFLKTKYISKGMRDLITSQLQKEKAELQSLKDKSNA